MPPSHYNFFPRYSSTPCQLQTPRLPVAFVPPRCTTEKSVRARVTSVSRTKLPHAPLHTCNLSSPAFPFLSSLPAAGVSGQLWALLTSHRGFSARTSSAPQTTEPSFTFLTSQCSFANWSYSVLSFLPYHFGVIRSSVWVLESDRWHLNTNSVGLWFFFLLSY